jgi:hypothetical protein
MRGLILPPLPLPLPLPLLLPLLLRLLLRLLRLPDRKSVV